MLNTPFSPWPSFTEDEANAVRDVILSNRVNYWTGEECRGFEQEFAAWCGTRHAVAVANGTVALDLALHALSVGDGDEVIVTSRTFLASVSSVVLAGATPVFVDVDRDSQNITADGIASAISSRTKAIICVHLAGWPCDMDPIMQLAAEHGLKVIEDCAQAHGARYKGRAVGSIGHIGAWSFCQDKVMTTGGEGGMVTTDDPDLWASMWAYKDHGKDWKTVYEHQHPPGFRWLHASFGTNWRMLEVQAVLGRLQLKKMTTWSEVRMANARKIWSCAESFKALRVPKVPADCTHAAYKCYVFVEPQFLKEGWNRDRIISSLVELEVPCFSGSCSEVYLEKAFDNTSFRPSVRLPIAKELGERSLMFLVHPTLTESNMRKTCEALTEVMLEASR
ncbi:DegT/DnrJ/EryC1/StrS aminotransferase family protein [Pseudomonas lurida]|jgi:dTDP-4-amino-4,6-dideoxygalactose transaminase|uniref:DegT/DnrJ/EryC1/StrS family aminotransferase n=1 Tax=Pseudomonas lurida TaxID=244566 RepID=UPI000F04ADEE|nr:DegT/DnrJ/EryC1/StrS aminotransferase family protein [Pseudomonas lurida]MBC3924656.1 DegT/DnrJ/EryC1/StrS aminotransferase family protein [Pseudomonas lurida]MBD8671001.1 DegT/DnrJ/EryC1/StrS aminotransferase family protein [Pseudomonas lurida]UZQ75827.1 DegT/DnrJ/EryC1/StrS aminotransferase family protein [Pseudomonas lurida]